ncbi:NAD-dependent protein deacetylase [Seminavis robusta]|uniref:NAD-dependent protein deacetylase n=1 Tax=Seminavis robusta TaxID=568900 RepID=A0A9N8E5C1_9STRA|nr:NAD-dependent protein deacetylase [Seminavis robusta]|eukprot:Sro688_g187470.1 NAD-dependent protein deacetylase (340) ;mRNA; f:49089-50108
MTTQDMTTPPSWCGICSLDLQSGKALSEHQKGQKHRKRAYRAGLGPCPASMDFTPTVLEEDEFFEKLASGAYKNIVVLTGAGVSTAAGIPDYRSSGGFFETFKKKYSGRFPGVEATPETLFSRSFVRKYPDVWENELLPQKQAQFEGLVPTLTHQFVSHLAHKGWLKRVYTQNIDGLHSHPCLGIPEDKVVECHGSIRRGDLVLYEDPLPQRFSDMAAKDFSPAGWDRERVDLIIVMGTSLQVAPFCALPNMAPKGSARVLVNRNLTHCITNPFSAQSWTEIGYSTSVAMKIGGRQNVPLASLWMNRDKIRKKKWQQLLVEDDCDDFVGRYMDKTNTQF